jgi:hypothetical protein
MPNHFFPLIIQSLHHEEISTFQCISTPSHLYNHFEAAITSQKTQSNSHF